MTYSDAYNEVIGAHVAAALRARGHAAYSGADWRQRRMPSGPPKLMDALFSPSLTVAPCARANLSSGRPRSLHRTPARTSSSSGDDPHLPDPPLGGQVLQPMPAHVGVLAWTQQTQKEKRRG
jgi:hypothetical protein